MRINVKQEGDQHRPRLIEGTSCAVRTFGSFKLGVHSLDADIDVLCVAPKDVSRYDFFDSFAALLRAQKVQKKKKKETEKK